MPESHSSLSLQAIRYAAGELTPDEAEAFEARLATDPAAQDALAEAVRLSARVLGQDAPTPDAMIRQSIAEQVSPPATWYARTLASIWQRRPYRGHPVTWASLGGGVSLAMVALVTWYGGTGSPDARATPGLTMPLTQPDSPSESSPIQGSQLVQEPEHPTGGGTPSTAPLHKPATTFLPPALNPEIPFDTIPGQD